MTFKEQFDHDYPDLKNKDVTRFGCPFDYGYEASHSCKDPTCRNRQHCLECWNRKMPSLKEATITFGNQKVEVSYSGREPIEHVDTAEFANTEPHILDSGERQEFSTGAERDIQKGKGLFDLVPLKVAARIFGAPYIQPDVWDVDPVLWCIGHYQDNGDTCWIYTALTFIAERVFPVGNDRRASIANMLLEVAIHFEEGARKYKPNNWKKGIPIERYIDSGTRHYTKWLRGDKDEPHNRAAAWNLICLAWEADFSPRVKGETATLYADNTPIEHIPSDLVRYGDCPAGLFEFGDEGVFVKTEIEDADKYGAYIAIHVNTGHTRLFDNDILVRPIDSPFTDERCGDE